MSTILFIHGTGVRGPGYEASLTALRLGLIKQGHTDLKVEGVPWGDDLGVAVTSEEIDDVLPTAAVRAALEAPTEFEVEAELWSILLDDPLFELRSIPLAPVERPPIRVGPNAEVATLADRINAIAPVTTGDVTTSELRAAAGLITTAIARERMDALALESDTARLPALYPAIARAIVAQALQAHRWASGDGPLALYVVEARNALVEVVRDSLGPQTRSGLDDVLRWSMKAAAARATAAIKTRRQQLLGKSAPGVGDIFHYLKRGDAIRDHIRAAMKACDARWVLGHSLGGIMAVDILSSPLAPTDVRGVVTLGSQSPYFLQVDALHTLRKAGSVHPPFVPWLNIFDRNDFLSFRAKAAFAHAGVQDLELTSGAPFPEAHGAYFHQRDVYKAIVEFCS